MSHETSVISRRTAFAGLAGFAALGLPSLAASQGAVQWLRSVSVDTSPISNRGAFAYGRAVNLYLTSALRRTFADRIDPRAKGAPALVARIESVTMTTFVGGNRSRFDGGASGNNDYLDGAGVLIGPGGAARARYPVLSVLDAASSGSWNSPDVDAQRLAALCDHFAWWLRRTMGV